MNKTRLIELVKDPRMIQEKELAQLVELTSQYPYSQILHILNAKGHHKVKHQKTSEFLQKAAVYCWDRQSLKRTIQEIVVAEEAPPWEEAAETTETSNFDWIDQEIDDLDTENTGTKDVSSQEEEIIEEVLETNKEAAVVATDSASELSEEGHSILEQAEHLQPEPISEESISEETESIDSEIAEEVEPLETESIADSKELATEAFEETEAFDQVLDKEVAATTESTETPEFSVDDELAVNPEEEIGESLADANDQSLQETTDIHPVEDVKDPLDLEIAAEIQQSSIHEELMDNLNKLQETRQQYTDNSEFSETAQGGTAEGEDLQQQIEIIDTFIKNSPVLSKPNLNAESEGTNQKDLSKKSITFSDDLVTEQLAKIMIKQGSKKEAVKIYKKLIVKFPKKKSYFASQIENLSKK